VELSWGKVGPGSVLEAFVAWVWLLGRASLCTDGGPAGSAEHGAGQSVRRVELTGAGHRGVWRVGHSGSSFDWTSRAVW
jgi:hypothetical protein